MKNIIKGTALAILIASPALAIFGIDEDNRVGATASRNSGSSSMMSKSITPDANLNYEAIHLQINNNGVTNSQMIDTQKFGKAMDEKKHRLDLQENEAKQAIKKHQQPYVSYVAVGFFNSVTKFASYLWSALKSVLSTL